MAEADVLAPSLSDEEAEAFVKDAKLSPQKSKTKKEGFKFNDTDLNVKSDFDFANKLSTGENPEVNSSDADEEFEHINQNDIDEINKNETSGNGDSSPSTPAKLMTPHKRGGGTVANGPNGSPPSSPAPKKRKHWKEYVAEDDAKKEALSKQSSPGYETSAPTDEIGNIFNKYLVTALTAILIAAFIAYVYPFGGTAEMSHAKGTASYSWKKISNNLMNMTIQLESEFPNQNSETWIQLIASIGETVKKTEPTHPASITILFPASMDPAFATCFARKIGNVVNKAFSPYFNLSQDNFAKVKELSPKTFSSLSITEFRSDIEMYLHHQGKAVITTNVNLFKIEEQLMVFHGLCDSFYAVDKRATFLFPVQVPEKIFKRYDWKHERGGDIANDVLTDSWKATLSPDSVPALVARVADSVIVLKEGDTCAV